MEKLIARLSAVVAEAFSAAGYDPACGRVTVSNRPDLCEFQCNGAMPAAKQHHKAPLVIAQDVVDRLQDGSVFASAEAVKPGFINLRVQPAYLAAHLEQMRQSERLGVTDGDRVRLTSRFGTCDITVSTAGRTRPPAGMVFAPFFAEETLINLVVQDTYCPLSKEPDFKKTCVSIEKI